MLNFDFPSGYHTEPHFGMMALPHGCWVVSVRKSPVSNLCSFVVYPNGERKLLHGHFQIWDYDQIRYGGNLDVAATLGLRFKSAKSTYGDYGILKIGNRHVRRNELRTRSLNHWENNCNPGIQTCFAAAASKFFPNHKPMEGCVSDLSEIIRGTIGKNPGIGFYRTDGSSRFINPDPSKNWLLACLSLDELTCLAVHETGGCVIDTPV